MTIKQLIELSIAIGSWATRNFKAYDPALGVLEEVGEMSHCLLKHKQGIRGFDKEDYFKAQLADGIADAAIYTLHNVFISGAKIGRIDDDRIETGRDFLGALGVNAGRLVCGALTSKDGEEIHSVILDDLRLFSTCYGIDFDQALTSTWDRVSKRNWKDNPEDAHAVAEAASSSETKTEDAS